jgi:glutamyl-tRNA reductase
MEQIRRAELERLGGKLADLTDEQRAQVDMLTASIVNKILHMPTVKMKEVAGSQECYLYVDAVRTLFDLSGNGSSPDGAATGDAATDAVGAAPDPPGATVHRTGTDSA